MNNSRLVFPKLYCIHYNECDPKKCTSLKLKKHGLLNIKRKIEGNLRKAILLNPFSQKILSSGDRTRILKHGLIVIDCSWNLNSIFNLLKTENQRKLPPLIASNPTNYGKWEKLSSVEALAAALYITNFKAFADLILSKFHWGLEFKRINNF
ncbi:MAG: DUF367 family protein [Candidatus Heimdallarchaeota archaeon]